VARQSLLLRHSAHLLEWGLIELPIKFFARRKSHRAFPELRCISCYDCSMPLILRPTGLSSPAYADQPDYIVCEDGKAIGRMYEDRQTLPELRWFWSITV
jgi:hypothetical protein